VLVPASEVEGAHAPKVIHWDDLQQELARLWSLSAALQPAGDRKAHLDSALQVIVSGPSRFRWRAPCSDPLLCPLSFDSPWILMLLLLAFNWEDPIRFHSRSSSSVAGAPQQTAESPVMSGKVLVPVAKAPQTGQAGSTAAGSRYLWLWPVNQ